MESLSACQIFNQATQPTIGVCVPSRAIVGAQRSSALGEHLRRLLYGQIDFILLTHKIA